MSSSWSTRRVSDSCLLAEIKEKNKTLMSPSAWVNGKGGHRLPKVSPGLAMPYPTSPCGRPPMKWSYVRFRGSHPPGERLVAPWTPHAVGLWPSAFCVEMKRLRLRGAGSFRSLRPQNDGNRKNDKIQTKSKRRAIFSKAKVRNLLCFWSPAAG